MTNKDTGGPAFPSMPGAISNGITVRDYFAARAMQAEYHLLERLDQFEGCAKGAYQMADAMLAARE